MGVVYKAENTPLRRFVALKLPQTSHATRKHWLVFNVKRKPRPP